MNLKDIKIFGTIGALLILIGIINSGIGFFVAIIGFILVLKAMKKFSEKTKEKEIYNNFLYFIIILIVAFVISGLVFAVTFIVSDGMSLITELQSKTSDPVAVWKLIEPIIANIFIALATLWVFLIISVLFLKKSFDRICEITNVKWFGTAGLLFLIGTATIIIGIGFLIILIGLVIGIIAFFSLPESLTDKKV